MNFNDGTEQAYKNGYEKVFKDCLEYLGLLSDYEKFGAAERSIEMTDKEIVIEKTFSEELPYFKERIKEVFDNYNNPNGNEDPLYICVLRDSDNIVRKAEEEITRQKTEIDELKHEREVLIEDIHCSADKINEQLEEIEKLEITIAYLECVCENTADKVRTEAIKEFVEKLKKRYDNPVWYLGGSNGFFDNLDNFVKEMVGDTE